MPIPTVVGIGTNVTNTTATTGTYPGSLAIGDLAILLLEYQDIAVGLPTPSGGSGTSSWSQIGSEVVQGGARAHAWWAKLTSASPTGPSISDSGDHTQSRILVLRGQHPSSPIHGSQDSTDPTSDTTGSITGFTTTLDDCLIVLLATGDLPDTTNTNEYSGLTNGALSSLTIQANNAVNTGGGGSKLVATGGKASAGAIGATTYNKLNNAVKAHKAIAIAPLVPTATTVARVSLEAGGEPVTRTEHQIVVRARKASGTGAVTLKAALYESGANKSGDLTSGSLTTSFAEYILPIPDASAVNITDYSNLEIRFWGASTAGEAVDVDVAEIWLEIPEAAAERMRKTRFVNRQSIHRASRW